MKLSAQLMTSTECLINNISVLMIGIE